MENTLSELGTGTFIVAVVCGLPLLIGMGILALKLLSSFAGDGPPAWDNAGLPTAWDDPPGFDYRVCNARVLLILAAVIFIAIACAAVMNLG